MPRNEACVWPRTKMQVSRGHENGGSARPDEEDFAGRGPGTRRRIVRQFVPGVQ